MADTEKKWYVLRAVSGKEANAYRIAARLVEEGKIKNIGKGRSKLYVLGEHDAK